MKIVSLFSGAGGLDLGFIKAGHEIIWANDNFHDATETYKKNIGSHIICEDIHLIDTNSIPDCDVVIGGFPCQGFSVANTQRSENDERNKLYLQFLRVLQAKKPKIFVAENVKGILTLNKGAVFKLILNDFTSAGYKVKYKLLNAADYGVPQRRERVLIVGVRDDIDFEYEYPLPTHTEKLNDTSLKKWYSIGEALKNIPEPEEPNNLLNHTYSKFKLKFNGYLGNRMIDASKPAPTVTARGDDKGGVVILHHPSNHRRMSVRELAIIQSFPNNFEFIGTNSSAYRQIGNAVPVELAYHIAKNIPKKL